MKYEDLTGMKFGKLTVLKQGERKILKSGQRQIRWICKCECGNTISTSSALLKNGKSKSCGCGQKEAARIANTKHGMYKDRIYKIFKQMHVRCEKEYSAAYKNYGGRGIKVCDEWSGENGFQNFVKWAFENGYEDTLSIDRIDNNGNYSPENCRWANSYVQSNNTRKNVNITWNGETHSLSVWGRIKPNGLAYDTLRSRLRDGWSIERAFTEPQHTHKKDTEGTLITIDGETHNVTYWCNISGIQKSTYYRRIKRGISPEQAILGGSKRMSLFDFIDTPSNADEY